MPRAQFAMTVVEQLEAYDRQDRIPREEDAVHGCREGYEGHVRCSAVNPLREVIVSHCGGSDADAGTVVFVALVGIEVDSAAAVHRLRRSLQNVSRQQIRAVDMELLVVVSWHASSPQLAAEANAIFDDEHFVGPRASPSAARDPQAPHIHRLAVACAKAQSQFQHLAAAFEGAQVELARRARLGEGAFRGSASVWVVFGDGADLWHSRRIDECARVVRGHPQLDGVGAFCSLARAALAHGGFASEDRLPSTDEQVEACFVDGRAQRLNEQPQWQRWAEELGREGQDVVDRPVPQALGLSFCDFCPRWRLVREFFAATPMDALEHRHSGARLCEFLSTYPTMGLERGLAVHFFEPDPSCWMCLSTSDGVAFSQACSRGGGGGTGDEGHDAQDAVIVRACGDSWTASVGAEDHQLANEHLHSFRLLDRAMSSMKLARCLAAFRDIMKRWLMRRHGRTIDQFCLAKQVLAAAHDAFTGVVGATPAARVVPAIADVCRAFEPTASEWAELLGVKVLQHTGWNEQALAACEFRGPDGLALRFGPPRSSPEGPRQPVEAAPQEPQQRAPAPAGPPVAFAPAASPGTEPVACGGGGGGGAPPQSGASASAPPGGASAAPREAPSAEERPREQFQPGQAVQVWSMSQCRWCEDGVVREVLAEGKVIDGAWIAKGAVHVIYDKGAGIKWILPHEQQHVLKRSESAAPRGGTPSGEPFKVGSAVHVWSLSKGCWVEDGLVQAVAALDMVGEDEPVARGSILVIYDRGRCWKWVPPWEQQQQVREPAGGCTAFSRGDTVHVFSLNRGGWCEDGLVQDVADRDMTLEGEVVLRGSILVTYNDGAGVKWVAPSEQEQILRKPARHAGGGGGSCSSSASPAGAATGDGVRCMLVGAHGGFLGVDRDSTLCMRTDGCTREQCTWTLAPLTQDGAQHLLQAPNGLCLTILDPSEQSFCFSMGVTEHAVWVLIPVDGEVDTFFLRSAHGTYLASLNDARQSIYMSPNAQDWEKWRLRAASPAPSAPSGPPPPSAASRSPGDRTADANAPPAANEQSRHLCEGAAVMVVRLEARPELNGLTGRVVETHGGRCLVRLEQGLGDKHFQANQLRVLDVPPASAASAGMPAGAGASRSGPGAATAEAAAPSTAPPRPAVDQAGSQEQSPQEVEWSDGSDDDE